METEFLNAVRREIGANIHNNHRDNWDHTEKGPEPAPDGYPALRPFVAPIRRLAARISDTFQKKLKPVLSDFRRIVQPQRRYLIRTDTVGPMGYLYDRLADQQSKDLLTKLATFRLMGHRHVKLPRNNPDFWSHTSRVESLPPAGNPMKIAYMDATLFARDLRPIGCDASTAQHAAPPWYTCRSSMTSIIQMHDVKPSPEMSS